MTTQFSVDATTEREYLLDFIVQRYAKDTPLLAALPRENTPNIMIEWSIDRAFTSDENARLPGSPHINSRLEGAAWPASRTLPNPTRLKAYCEIQSDVMEVSNSTRPQIVAGVSNTFDYYSGKTYTLHLNRIDNIAMYGQGTNQGDGSTLPRKAMGLIAASAWTGLERTGETGLSQMEDPYGSTIQAADFSVFYDAAGAQLTSDMFYRQLIRKLLQAGADLSTNPWRYMVGYGMMSPIARFLIADGGIPLASRDQPSSDTMGRDFLSSFKLPDGTVVSFTTNRWLDDDSSTYTIDNRDNITPGTPTSPGTLSKTFNADQTLIGWEPGSVVTQWYRSPGFREVDSGADTTKVALVSEFTFRHDAPLCVAGMGNASFA